MKVFVWIYRVVVLGLLILISCMGVSTMPPEMDRVDIITIMLGATGVMLAVLTIFLAIAALVGYIEIRRSAHKIAILAAEKAAQQAAERVASQTVEEYLAQRFEKPDPDDYGVGAAGGGDAGKS